jgi:hypothetical protein
MGDPKNTVVIKALTRESYTSHKLDVLTDWTLDVGKVTKVRDVKDDLANNRVDVNFLIVDGSSPVLNKLTTIHIQNPISELDPNHKVYVKAYMESTPETVEAEAQMNTGDAHGN